MSAITAKASRKMKKYAVLTREPRCFLGSFDFSWEQRKFEEIAVRSSVICSDDTLPRVEYEDIVSGTGRLNKDIYAKQSIKSGIAFHQGDVLYGKLRPYLQNWLLPTFDGLAVGDFWVLQPQNADSSFLYRLIQSRQFDEVANQSTGTKMPRADWKLVSKTVFSIPSNISEQAAIGTYFTALDSLITLHQRKCVFLFGFFQAFISMIFTASTFSWEQRKLGECFSERVESMPDGELISVTINDGIKKFFELGRHDNSNDNKSKYKKVCVGDIAYNSMRMWQGASGYSPYEGIVSPAYTVLSPNAGVFSRCIAYQFKLPQMIHTFQINSQGITSDNWNLKYPTLSEIEIYISKNVAEQKQIAEFFTSLDNLITLHQRECISFTARAGRRILTANKKRNTSSWEQRKLGELVDVCSGRDYKHLSEGTIPVYGTGGYMLSVNDALSYDRDAIGIGRKGTIDRPYILKAPFWTVDTLFYAIPREKVDLNYAFDIFQNIDWKKKDESTGVPSLSKTAINDIDVLAPKHDEQQIIGQFFAAIDNLITLHQRKGKAAVTGCSNDANNSKGVYCKARDFGYKCCKKVESP